MLSDLIAAISLLVLQTIEYFGYAGVFFLMALESANIPVPSEVIMPFSGFLVSQGAFSFWAVVFWGAFGNLAGSLFSYWLGFRWGRKALPYAKYLLLHEHDIVAAERWFARFGNVAAFFSRLLPVVRTFISFPAGIFRVPLLSFSLYTLAGSFAWSAFLAYLGMVLGENWHALESYFRQFDIAIVALGAAVVTWWIYRHFSRNGVK
ncbi:MAG: DedA family protein [Candidatus Yanofskybacteria bacterium]|nr:DedA family protein [Candidatus Yanofskybacteria bacterium]